MASMVIDEAPAQDSKNLVESGGVFSSIEVIKNNIEKTKNLELWNDITLSENVKNVSMSQTDTGKPLNIKRLFLLFTGKVKEKKSFLVLRLNGYIIYQMWNTFSRTDEESNFTVWVYVEKIAPGIFISRYSKNALGVTDIDSIQGLANANSEVGSAITRWANKADEYQKATSWNFGATSDLYQLKSGSRIMVWGQQDDD